jgi:hypothetical protein
MIKRIPSTQALQRRQFSGTKIEIAGNASSKNFNSVPRHRRRPGARFGRRGFPVTHMPPAIIDVLPINQAPLQRTIGTTGYDPQSEPGHSAPQDATAILASPMPMIAFL